MFYSIGEITVCDRCEIELKARKRVAAVPSNIRGANTNDVQSLLKEEKRESKSKCTKCNEFGKIKRIPSRILVIDLGSEIEWVQLTGITQHIEYGRRQFALKGVIEHRRGGSGHFLAHVKRTVSNIWETFDDTQVKIQKSPPTIRPVLLVYVMEEDEDEEDSERPTKTLSSEWV